MIDPPITATEEEDVMASLKAFAEDVVGATIAFLASLKAVRTTHQKVLVAKATPEVVEKMLRHAQELVGTAAQPSARNLMIAASLAGNRLPPPPLVETTTDIDALIAAEVAKIWGDPAVASEEVGQLLGRRGAKPPRWLKHLAVKAKVEETKSLEDISRTPVIPVAESIQDDHIVCLIDGAKKKMLSRYLLSRYGITPEEYRGHFGLPEDYPMTCKSYRDEKARLASVHGLGTSPDRHLYGKPVKIS